MVALRLLSDGSLDRSFGNEGLVTLAFGRARSSGAFQMVLLPDGGILLGGYAHGAPAFACLLPGGVPDPRFGAMAGSAPRRARTAR
jgi:hypothetical protein